MYLRDLSDLKYIVIHHSVTSEDCTVGKLRQMHLNKGYSDIGYHFLITKDGLKVGRGIQYNGAHALSEKSDIKMNHHGVGICIIGDFSKVEISDKLVNETAYAIKKIAEKYEIPINRKHIIPHYAVDYTACPMEKTMKKIYEKLEI